MKIAGRKTHDGEFLELAGFIHDEDTTSYLVAERSLDASSGGVVEILLKSEGWQALTTNEVFAFGDKGLLI